MVERSGDDRGERMAVYWGVQSNPCRIKLRIEIVAFSAKGLGSSRANYERKSGSLAERIDLVVKLSRFRNAFLQESKIVLSSSVPPTTALSLSPRLSSSPPSQHSHNPQNRLDS